MPTFTSGNIMKAIIKTVDGLHVTEGVSGVWHYHLSSAGTNATALCGAKTMSTEVPVSAWGARGHLNEKWCATCASQASRALRQAGVEPAVA